MVAKIDQLPKEQPSPLFDTLHDLGIDCIPFASRLSFLPLIRYIKQRQHSKDFGEAFLAKNIIEMPTDRRPIFAE